MIKPRAATGCCEMDRKIRFPYAIYAPAGSSSRRRGRRDVGSGSLSRRETTPPRLLVIRDSTSAISRPMRSRVATRRPDERRSASEFLTTARGRSQFRAELTAVSHRGSLVKIISATPRRRRDGGPQRGRADGSLVQGWMLSFRSTSGSLSFSLFLPETRRRRNDALTVIPHPEGVEAASTIRGAVSEEQRRETKTDIFPFPSSPRFLRFFTQRRRRTARRRDCLGRGRLMAGGKLNFSSILRGDLSLVDSSRDAHAAGTIARCVATRRDAP